MIKKPKTLYRFSISSRSWQKHKVLAEDAPQLIEQYPWGTLWRNRSALNDFYGYEQKKEAKVEAIQFLQAEIGSLNEMLTKFRKETSPPST